MSNGKKEIKMEDVMAENFQQSYVDPTGMTQAMGAQPVSAENKVQGFSLTPLDRAMNFIAPLTGGPFAALQKAKKSAFRAMSNAGKGEEVSAANNVAQNDQNGADTISTSTDGGEQAIVTQDEESENFIPLMPGKAPKLSTRPNFSMGMRVGKQQSQQNNKITGSKTRMGLFGNYGKDVKIAKTYDPSTGKITRQKFVDGEQVKKDKGFKGVRRAKRAGNFGRKQRLANSNNQSNSTNTKKNNNSGSSSNFMMSGFPFR